VSCDVFLEHFKKLSTEETTLSDQGDFFPRNIADFNCSALNDFFTEQELLQQLNI
jgi:hypothetical protein